VLARTDTAWLFAFVDHTQTTKVASWPALTSPVLDSDWTRTQSCGVTGFLCFLLGELAVGLGELGFGLAVGLGELADGLGVALSLGLGLGVVVAEVDAEEFDEDEDVAVALGLSLPDVLADADGLPLADVLGAADELADLSREEDLASAVARSWLVASFVADDSDVLFGVVPHTADLVVD
jgi:hypothetical protein